MNLNDEELQRRIEANDLVNDGPDAQAYRRIFKALGNEPSATLPANFTDVVVRRSMALNQKRESSRDFWWFGVGIFFLVIAMIVSFAFIGFKLNVGVLSTLSDYKGLLLAGFVLILIFNFAERKLLGGKQHRTL